MAPGAVACTWVRQNNEGIQPLSSKGLQFDSGI